MPLLLHVCRCSTIKPLSFNRYNVRPSNGSTRGFHGNLRYPPKIQVASMVRGPVTRISLSLVIEYAGSNSKVRAFRYLLRPLVSLVGSMNRHASSKISGVSSPVTKYCLSPISLAKICASWSADKPLNFSSLHQRDSVSIRRPRNGLIGGWTHRSFSWDDVCLT